MRTTAAEADLGAAGQRATTAIHLKLGADAMADALAKEGAQIERVTEQERKRMEGADLLAWRVQGRIIATSIEAMKKQEGLDEAEEKKLGGKNKRKDKRGGKKKDKRATKSGIDSKQAERKKNFAT